MSFRPTSSDSNAIPPIPGPISDLTLTDRRIPFKARIPGALEGLIIGLPFYILPIPETPYIVLSLLTALGSALLAWYICRRIPRLSFTWTFLWIASTPWILHKCDHIINPAYDFLPSVMFFIGFMESIPYLSTKRIPLAWCNALMGFSLFWIMQFHFSYVYLIPLAGLSLLVQVKEAKNPRSILFFIGGALPTIALIIPTFVKYGLSRSNVASGFTVPFNWYNVSEGLTILARYFSLVCYELPRYIGTSTTSRFAFLNSHPWLWPFGSILWVGGLIQPFVMLFAWFQKKHQIPGWTGLKILILLMYLMIWVSFWFTVKLPLSHIYLVLYPWLMLYSFYCWAMFAENAKWRLLGKAFVVMGLLFQLGYALAVAPQDSIYNQRPLVAKALQQQDYRVLSERREGSLY